MDVVAVCSAREPRAKEIAAHFGIPHAFSDYRDLLNLNEIDAVSIASPRQLHYPMAMEAINLGKHVICEKPFTTELDHAKDLWLAAEKSGLTCMLAHQFRFTSGRSRVKELIEEGYIGNLHTVIATLINGSRLDSDNAPYSPNDDMTTGGGLLWSQGSHYLDCLRHWFGEIRSVTGDTRTHVPNRTDIATGETIQATADDAFHATIEFINGGTGQITMSYASAFGPGGNISIYGSQGTLVTPQDPDTPNPPSHGIVLGARVGDDKLAPVEIPHRLQPFEDDRDMRLMPMRLFTREFLRGIETRTSPNPNFYDGLRVQQILHAVRLSSSTGTTIYLDSQE
jgi:predicted dehydrogenase